MSGSMGRVYLVGAGCGRADLITLRGLELLRRCDTVVYDDLIDTALLDWLPAGAETVYMGKRQGRHAASQEEISRLLVEKAREGKTVVRLKGGDPFVFGRGGEEILALQAAGVPCEEVPGVTSAIAVPALAGIPVTHRGVSRSVHIVTAHTADTPDGLPPQLEELARLEGTLVFLMGLTQLPRLAERLLAAGMAPDTPAAVAAMAGTVRGTLADISERAANLRPPAVIVVGPTAAMDLSATVPKPLAGIVVGLTGTAALTDKLRALLEDLGAEAFPVQRPVVEPLPWSFDWEKLCKESCWAVFTSVNGVRIFLRRLAEGRVDLRRLARCRFAAIGAATAAALEEAHITPDLCPAVHTTQALGGLLLERASPEEPVYLFRSRRGDPALREALSRKLTVRDIPLYDLRPDEACARRAASRLEELDYLAFGSAGGVAEYFAAHGGVPAGTVCVCIGEVTAKALRRRHNGPIRTAPAISAEGVAEAILEHHRLTSEGKADTLKKDGDVTAPG